MNQDPTSQLEPSTAENSESFGDILSQYERTHTHRLPQGKGLEGTVVAITSDSAVLDIGFKAEGVLLLTALKDGAIPKPGERLPVTIKGRNPEGYYELALGRVERPKDWASLEKAFAEKASVAGTVTGVVKGGMTVDIGVRAFMPASRSGTADAAAMEKLIGQEIRCRIIELDVAEEEVVVDRRAVSEEEARITRERRYSEIKEGEIVTGTVRSLMDYGAFVDVGGVDGLLHVADISWSRNQKPADLLSTGQQIEAKVLKVDHAQRRISLGMKQLLPDPWSSAAERFKVGERIRGAVTRLSEFGAFVEIEPGLEGLIHISEMSWSKRIRKSSDVVKPGETVEAVILGVSADQRRISLGLKQALGDPWAEIPRKFPAGSIVEGPVSSLTNFGAFVQISEGVEGMIHIGDITAEKRLQRPHDALRVGQIVKAQVLEVDVERRRLRLGMKQLAPTGMDDYLAEHKEGEVVTGRIMEIAGEYAQVELGEGVHGRCPVAGQPAAESEAPSPAKADLSSLSSMLQARWKGGAGGTKAKPEAFRAGQVRNFRLARLDRAGKKIELEAAN